MQCTAPGKSFLFFLQIHITGGRARSGDGALLCPAQLPGAPEPLAAHDLIKINSNLRPSPLLEHYPARSMRRTLVQRVGQESVSLQALVPWCSSCNGLIARMVTYAGESDYPKHHKRLARLTKLATRYEVDRTRHPWLCPGRALRGAYIHDSPSVKQQ